MALSPRHALAPLLLVAGLMAGLESCSLRRIAVGGLSDALSSSADSFAREDDPELVRASLPFALKAIEGVLLEEPLNEKLLVAASSGFALYSYAFLELDADAVEARDYGAALHLRERALALYLRARDYALRGLEHRHPGIGERLRRAPWEAARELERGDLDLAYAAGGAWGLAISLGKDRPELVADVDAVRALLARALEIDEAYRGGAIHEALIAIEGLPAAMGGSEERAREHFRRALELCAGTRASPYLALAESVCVPRQDRAEFDLLLQQALAVDLEDDPAQRLANRLAQDRARRLLASIDELFLPPLE